MAQFTIRHITPQKIEELLRHMLSHKATGSDGIGARMVLNASKTKSLLVTGKRLEKKALDTALKISCNSSEIDQVNSQKLHGVKLDSHLNFTEHIDDICKKVSRQIAVLKKVTRNLPLAERKLYFNALIKPIMSYGS
ncbi:hypothetical protein pdam_00022442 [Pocillopora damicornis]|uniref:Reverse transcriptase domain-containing protein n=1 Tax=Pocillopora damicornis TaxID=46731 RepID=A0A3M6TEU5_POCDA|nr:hypothetical protein pdam_00022442 [Pocillopora damicornis]